MPEIHEAVFLPRRIHRRLGRFGRHLAVGARIFEGKKVEEIKRKLTRQFAGNRKSCEVLRIALVAEVKGEECLIVSRISLDGKRTFRCCYAEGSHFNLCDVVLETLEKSSDAPDFAQ